MTETDKTLDARATILGTIRSLLERRGDSGTQILPDSSLAADLGLESLELAELSAALEDELGRDPFSEGILPTTVAQLLEFYGA